MSLCPVCLQAQVIDMVLNKVSNQPFYFSVPVEDGNYKVTVILGNKKKAAHTVPMMSVPWFSCHHFASPHLHRDFGRLVVEW